jgi:hypothetical protein
MPTNPSQHNPVSRAKYTPRRTKRVDLDEPDYLALERICIAHNITEAEALRRGLRLLVDEIDKSPNDQSYAQEATMNGKEEFSDEQLSETLVQWRAAKILTEDQIRDLLLQYANSDIERVNRLMSMED